MKFGPIAVKFSGVVNSPSLPPHGDYSPAMGLEYQGQKLLASKQKETCDDRKEYVCQKRKRRTKEEKEPKMKRKVEPANIAMDVAKGCCNQNCIR